MTLAETTPPNVDPTPPTDDANRTAGEPLDAGVPMTQAQIDAIIQSRLAEERRRTQAKYGDLDDLLKAKQQLDDKTAAELSEMEKLQKTIDDMKAHQDRLQQEAEAARLNTLRLRVGHELGLPPVLAERLTGADEDAMKADAAIVLAAVKIDPRVPNLDATAGGGQTGAGKPRVKLTPAQEQIARSYGMTNEAYAELLQQFEE